MWQIHTAEIDELLITDDIPDPTFWHNSIWLDFLLAIVILVLSTVVVGYFEPSWAKW